MRWAIDEAFRALMRAGLLVQKYDEPTARERGHEATPVQSHVLLAHHNLKTALETLEEENQTS
jgi:hypothetical protein